MCTGWYWDSFQVGQSGEGQGKAGGDDWHATKQDNVITSSDRIWKLMASKFLVLGMLWPGEHGAYWTVRRNTQAKPYSLTSRGQWCSGIFSCVSPFGSSSELTNLVAPCRWHKEKTQTSLTAALHSCKGMPISQLDAHLSNPALFIRWCTLLFSRHFFYATVLSCS